MSVFCAGRVCVRALHFAVCTSFHERSLKETRWDMCFQAKSPSSLSHAHIPLLLKMNLEGSRIFAASLIFSFGKSILSECAQKYCEHFHANMYACIYILTCIFKYKTPQCQSQSFIQSLLTPQFFFFSHVRQNIYCEFPGDTFSLRLLASH